jgi:titin
MRDPVGSVSVAVRACLLALALLPGVAGGAGASGSVLAVTSTNDSGPGSLRVAIEAANANPGLDTIVFAIPGSGTQTIAVTSSGLPTISDPVVIDGRTQPGFAATPLIRLDNQTGSWDSGLRISAGPSEVRGLSITGFGSPGGGGGILLGGNGGNIVAGNWIGLDPSGAAAPNLRGVDVRSPNNIIGGLTAGDRNVISGNGDAGLLVGFSGNVVEGNYIGTDATGSAAVPNGNGVAVDLAATSNTIGGRVPGARNVISGNAVGAISMYTGTWNNLIEGNYIGTDKTGNVAIANGSRGTLTSGAVSLGGNDTVANNVISGNAGHGISIGMGGNTIAGNRIGTNAAGTRALPNLGSGVYVSLGSYHSNVIGGANSTDRNIISGNAGNGVEIVNPSTSGNLVEGNYIGTDKRGTSPLGNGLSGVLIAGSSGNTIGGTSRALRNRIAYNSGAGVTIDASAAQATANPILANSIYDNGGLGIALIAGGNDSQTAPAINSISSDATTTTVKGTLTGPPSEAFRLELFVSPSCDPSGSGEGAGFLRTKTITTDAGGIARYTIKLPLLSPGPPLTATATGQSRSATSQFSACASS